jgi:hypothetical protein
LVLHQVTFVYSLKWKLPCKKEHSTMQGA